MLVPLLLLLLFLNATEEFNHLGPDTTEYLSFRDEILSGALFSTRELQEIPTGSIIRTPGFPGILALGHLVSPGDLRTEMIVGHSLLFAVVFLLIAIANREAVPAPLLGVLIFPALPQLREVFAGLASEWTAYCFLLLTFGILLRFFRSPSTYLLYFLGISASLTVLTRPALCLVAGLPLFAALFLKEASWFKRAILALSSLFLMWLWMGFNWHRLGSFSLAPRGGANIFCIGALIGKASIHPSDPPEVARYFEALRLETYSAPREELAIERSLKLPDEFFANYVTNYEIADRIAAIQGIDRVKQNEYLGMYGLRSIKENFPNYLLHLYYGAHNFLLTGYLALPGLILPLLWLRKRRHIAASLSALSMLYVHLSHLSLVLLTQPLLSRYYAATFYPLLLASLLIISIFVREHFLRPRPPGSRGN